MFKAARGALSRKHAVYIFIPIKAKYPNRVELLLIFDILRRQDTHACILADIPMTHKLVYIFYVQIRFYDVT